MVLPASVDVERGSSAIPVPLSDGGDWPLVSAYGNGGAFSICCAGFACAAGRLLSG